MTKQEAIAELKDIKSFEISEYGEEKCEETLDALDMAIEALEEKEALRLLIDWAVECGFGFDNIPEEYERHKDYIEKDDIGYIDGLIYIAK